MVDETRHQPVYELTAAIHLRWVLRDIKAKRESNCRLLVRRRSQNVD